MHIHICPQWPCLPLCRVIASKAQEGSACEARREASAASRTAAGRGNRCYSVRRSALESGGTRTMCGIVGYVGPKPVAEVLIEGLRKLEYRGYDSAGIAVVEDGRLDVRRCAGKLKNLEEILARQPVSGTFGIAHTRWATHGPPTDENAHPHPDCGRTGVCIRNGIIEDFLEPKAELRAEGQKFAPETDTEIIAHLVEKYMDGRPLEEAVRAALPRLGGVYALAVIATSDPGKIVAARLGPPLIIGVGEGENFVASDIPAVLVHTRNVIFLADGEMAIATKDKVLSQDAPGNERAA